MSVTNLKNLESDVIFRDNFLYNYLLEAPIALAIERAIECEILSQQKFTVPVLDIGCGEGMFAYILFDQKVNVGIDPQNSEVKRAREYGRYEETLCCYGNKIPKDDKSFNTIFSNSVLEHIVDLKSVLKEAYRLLADDGNFYITIPTDRFDQYTWIYSLLTSFKMNTLAVKYRKFFNNFWKHYHYYNREEWTQLFQEVGFKVKESKHYAPKSICLFNNLFVPFAVPARVLKKFRNRWILSENFRKTYLKLLFPMLNAYVSKHKNDDKGGVIFFHLSKK